MYYYRKLTLSEPTIPNHQSSSFYNNNKIVENSHLQVIFLYVKGTVSQDSSSSDPFIDMLRYFQIWFLFCIHCTTFCAFFPQCHRRRRVNFMASMLLWSQKYYQYLFKSFFSGIKGGCFVKFLILFLYGFKVSFIYNSRVQNCCNVFHDR